MLTKGIAASALIGIGIGTLGLVACEKSTPPAKAAAIETYTTRGRVEGITDRPGVSPMIQVHHEEIPAFKNREGKVIGMKEMVMDFPAEAGVKFDGFRPGDLVEVQFSVDWTRMPYHAATKLTKLPAGTELKLGKFEEPGAKGNGK